MVDSKSYPRVSIVVVNFNGYKWLKLFLPSIARTDYPDFETIVVDNGSADLSVEYLKNDWHDLVRVVELKNNMGFAEGCNIGAREASGKIIAFLNNDMEVDNGWLKAAVDKLTSDSSVGAVQAKMMQHNNGNRIDGVGLSVDKFGIHRVIGHDEVDRGQYDDLQEIGGCCGGAMIVWKDILQKTGYFDTKFFLYYEDMDLSWRIKLAGYKILPAHSSIVYHMGSSTSKTIPSTFVTFHLTKNYLISWLKNSRLSTIVLYWPVVILVTAGLSFYDLLNGRFGLVIAHFRAILWVLFHLGYVLRERHKVQHQIRKPEINPDNILFIGTKDHNSSNLFLIIKRAVFLLRHKL